MLFILCVYISLAGIVGEIGEGGDGYHIWTHKKFDMGYNGKQIVDVNLTSEVKIKLAPNIKIPFTYEVSTCICSILPITEHNLAGVQNLHV